MDPQRYIVFSCNHDCAFYNFWYNKNAVIKQNILKIQESREKEKKVKRLSFHLPQYVLTFCYFPAKILYV